MTRAEVAYRRVVVLADVHGNADGAGRGARRGAAGGRRPARALRRPDLGAAAARDARAAGLAPSSRCSTCAGTPTAACVELDRRRPRSRRRAKAWMVERHGPAGPRRLATFAPSRLLVEVDGLGPCSAATARRGATRSASPSRRPRPGCGEALAGVEADVVVDRAHPRPVRPRGARPAAAEPRQRGMPYEGRPGAYWALLGPGVELGAPSTTSTRRSPPTARAAIRSPRRWSSSLLEPPAPAEVVEHAERLVFSG